MQFGALDVSSSRFGVESDWGTLSEPAKTILIVHGDPKGSLKSKHVTSLVKAGGAVLFASDQEVNDPNLAAALGDLTGYVISGQTVVCEKGMEIRLGEGIRLGEDIRKLIQSPRYRNENACPFLVSPEGASPALLYLGGLRQERELRVATNRPSYLVNFAATGRSTPRPCLRWPISPPVASPIPRGKRCGASRVRSLRRLRWSSVESRPIPG